MVVKNTKELVTEKEIRKAFGSGRLPHAANDSLVLNKSVLPSKAALDRIIASVSHYYCCPINGALPEEGSEE